MFTRCPECQTAFRITIAQLKARDGLVRCGRCDSVFRADLRLFAAPDANGRARSDDEPRFTIDADSDSEYIDIDAGGEVEIPVVSDLSLFQAPRRGVPTVVWLLGTLLATALLVGQFAYFYREELAQLPDLRPVVAQFCELMQCRLAAPTPNLVPELLDSHIAPHPRYANVLRIHVSMVNRTDAVQPPPLMEVSLTDSNGKLLARRTFTPHQYLGSRAAEGFKPNIVIEASIDVTNPDGKAAGFEVRLLPRESANDN